MVALSLGWAEQGSDGLVDGRVGQSEMVVARVVARWAERGGAPPEHGVVWHAWLRVCHATHAAKCTRGAAVEGRRRRCGAGEQSGPVEHGALCAAACAATTCPPPPAAECPRGAVAEDRKRRRGARELGGVVGWRGTVRFAGDDMRGLVLFSSSYS